MTVIVPGQQIGAFRIVEQVGKGGMARVYKAYQASMDRFVALKILPFEFAQNEEFLQRFRREVVTIARLEHPHILPVYDSGEFQGTPYLVMRYLDAGTLKERMQRGRLSLAEIDLIFSQLADALEYAHRHDVVHRDIKPANVMLTPRDDVLLTDFGIAKLLGADSQVTATGAITGTPSYMSPEQGDGRPVDHRSDIYSLGIVLYEMVTGRVPFEAETPLAVILQHLQAPLPPPSSIVEISPDIEQVILKALSKEPGDRFGTTAEFLEAWRQALRLPSPTDQPVPDTSAGAGEKTIVDPLEPTLIEPVPAAAETMREPAARPAEAPTANLSTAAAQPKTPPRRRPAWFLLAGAAVLIVLGGCVTAGYAVFRVCCSPTADEPGGFPGISGLGDATPTPPADGTSGNEPAPPAAAPDGEPFVADPLPFPEVGGTWDTWTGAEEVFSVVEHDGLLYAGGSGGIRVYDDAQRWVDTITVADGLRTNAVRYLYSDLETGDLWAATDEGAARFNGTSWINYGMEDGLVDVSLIFIGRVGTEIMAGAAYGFDGGGIYVFDGSSWSNLSGFDSTSGGSAAQFDSSVREILRTPNDGLLWVATGSGLGVWDGSGWKRYTTEEGLPDNVVNGLGIDGQGRLVVSTEGGAVVVEGDTIIPLEPTLGYPITDILVDLIGDTWFAASDGVFRYAPDTGNWDFYESEIQFPTYGVYRGAALPNGWVFFGTSDMGVIAFDGSTFAALERPDEPRQAASGQVLLEPSGGLLFVEEYGLRLDRFDPLTGQWTDASPEVCCILPYAFDAAGNLWGGGDTGVWRLAPDGGSTQLNLAQGLPTDLVTDLVIGMVGEIWAGTDAGLVLIKDGLVTEIFDPRDLGLSSSSVRTLLLDSAGGIWAGTDAGLLHRGADGEWETFTEGAPFSESYSQVVDLAEGMDGTIWVSAYGDGVFRYTGAAWEHFLPEFSSVELPSMNVNVIHTAPDGAVWFGTDAGVTRYDGASWWTWTIEDGLAHWYVNEILVLADGTSWFATSGGITRWAP